MAKELYKRYPPERADCVKVRYKRVVNLLLLWGGGGCFLNELTENR